MTYQSTYRQEKPNLHRQVLEMSIDREKVAQVKVDKQREENALKQMSQKTFNNNTTDSKISMLTVN